jgi:hypothetical protein
VLGQAVADGALRSRRAAFLLQAWTRHGRLYICQMTGGTDRRKRLRAFAIALVASACAIAVAGPTGVAAPGDGAGSILTFGRNDFGQLGTTTNNDTTDANPVPESTIPAPPTSRPRRRGACVVSVGWASTHARVPEIARRGNVAKWHKPCTWTRDVRGDFDEGRAARLCGDLMLRGWRTAC